MNIYEKLVRLRDEVSLERAPETWEKRADVLAQIAAQAFLNEDKRDEVPKGFYINDCELTLSELKEIFAQLDLPVDEMQIEITDTDPDTGDIFVEVFI